ncbi:MBL fold metallo-hydrolase [Undibacterium amnicola]|uniref:MBL fold metallo-hydrolase n=1 Tax=Undibacterium amnicola TaxID=1834038 RepID=A0ABR6XUV6_9BURK|nr:MBL fold metallo-hydrolase [Undibacterium amnicola]MBC3832717.1 MBL fold metallo-hydrolase [Undibacterium amnicola]
MKNAKLSTLVAAVTIALSSQIVSAADLQTAASQLNATNTKNIEFSGTGYWYQFGQAPHPKLAWPQFDLSSYKASINFDDAAARVQIVRKQSIEKGRDRPTPVEQRPDQYVQGNYAWSLATPVNASAPTASAQPAAVEERTAEIWSTPQGFLKAALVNNATSKNLKSGVEVSFKVNEKYRYVGIINAKNQVESIKTWIDNPVLGDTLIETKFSAYKDFSGVSFPSQIVRLQGGFPVLKLNIDEVKANTDFNLSAPQNVVDFKAPAITVNAVKLADGVFHLTGGTHNSVAIEQTDHIVVVEAPLNEARSLAVIAKVKEAIPGKPIKFLVNSHAHFDHAGGLRTYVDEGSIILTEEQNLSYYQRIWAAPHSINPDNLDRSKKAALFKTFKGKLVLNDGKRKIEVHSIAGNSHNDAFALVYLPAEKILIQADAFNPPAAGTPIPVPANPFSVNLYSNIKKLRLDVETIAGLHGAKAVGLADLQAYIGQQ